MFVFRAIGNYLFGTSSNGEVVGVAPSTSTRIPKKVRSDVWEKYFKNTEEGICYTCGDPVRRYRAGFQCAHVVARSKGGQDIVENLRVCCQGCNLEMGTKNLYVYMKERKMNGPGKRNINKYLKAHPECARGSRIQSNDEPSNSSWFGW